MPDSPDDFDQSYVAAYPSSGDMNELAARLSPAFVQSRHGMALFYTDFSHGMAGISQVDYSTSFLGTIRTSSYSRSGLELYLYTTLDFDNSRSASILQPIIEGQYYIISAQLVAAQGHGGYNLGGRVGFNGDDYAYDFNYYVPAKTIEIRTTGGVMIDITDRFTNPDALTTIHQVTIIIDIVNSRYHSITFNSDTVDISDIPLVVIAGISVDRISMSMSPFTDNSTYFVLEVQNVVLSVSDIVQ